VAGAIVVLLCRAVLGQTIPNPSFEADTFNTSPGYISVNAPITGWTANPTDEVGLNPAGGQSPFADNGAIPNGNNVAFIQAGSAADSQQGTLSTTISGLTVGTTYKVNLRANARSGQAPTLRLSIDGAEIMAMTMHSAGPNNPYWYIAFEFTAAATSQVLGVLNDVTSSDNTLLVDDFSIAPSSGKWVVDAWNDDASSGLDSSYYYTHAYKFGNAGNFSINGVAFTGLGGNNPQVPGSFSTTFLTYGPAGGGATVTGDSTNLAVNFDYGYSIPVGSPESITLNGLTPGTNYVATVFSYGWDDITVDSLIQRWATFSMGNDRLTVQQDQFGLDNGIRISYTYTADSSGNATINIAPINIAGNYSFHVCGFANREAVSRNVAPTITTQPHTLIVTPGLGATFSVIANGLPAPTYQWRYNGGNINGAQASGYTIPAASGINVGSYDVIVANSAGSVTSVVAQLIVGIPLANPSFEVDAFATYPGYCSVNTPITDWTLDSLGGGGLNPSTDGQAPFASNGPIPDGKQFAFIQASGDILHQTVSGFTIGDPYYVHYYEGARAGYPSPGMEVRVGGATVLAAHAIPSGANSYFETFSDLFVATNASLDVAFVKSNPVAGDTTAVLDDVAVVHIAPSTAPFVTRNPQPVLASVADSVTFWAQGVGSPPLAFQWLKNGAVVPGANTEVLTLNNIQKAAEADYSLWITNSSGSVTSAVAHLTVYELIPDLFNTGVNSNRVSLADGSVDPHYQLIVNPDTGSTNAIVEDSSVFPIAGGATWLADTATSKWIGPQFNTGGSVAGANGFYTYRTVIDLTGRDPSTLIINGQWAVDNTGNDIQVNGHSTGNGKCLGFNPYTAFNIYGTNGLFVAGKNNIDFLVQNTDATVGYTGLRVEIIRSNLRIPPGTPPEILTPPVGQTATVGDTITFTASARGSAPLSYQWEKNGVAIPDQTTLSLTLTNVTTADSGFYSMLVSNPVGSTNSSAAALNVAYQPIPGICFGTGVAADGTLLAAPAVDPHYILTVSADGNFPGPNAILVSNVWPIAAGAWLLNGPNSAWIAPQADQSGAPYPDGTYGGNSSGDYTYETSFNLTGQNLSRVFISGAWATDNVGTGILVNGVNSGNTNTVQFAALTPFILTATNGLVAGPNTLDFLVNNAAGTPDVPGPTGLRVDLKLISLITPKLQLSRSGANLNIAWWPTFAGQQLLSAPTAKGPWTPITGAANPYMATLGTTNTFYRVSQ
jgi:hypothetical protein